MTLKSMLYFQKVYEDLNMTQAAKELFVSQTAVTKQIQLLEEEWGVALFMREHKTILPTKAADFLYLQVKNVLSSYHLANDNMKAFLKGEQGKLRLGLIKEMDTKLLMSLLSSFHQSYPHVDVQVEMLSNEEMNHLLKQGDLDVGIGIHGAHELILKNYPLILLSTKEGSDQILFDVRHMKDYPHHDLEETLLHVALGEGQAIVHDFALNDRYRPFINAIPLEDEHMPIALLYDDHFSLTKDIFLGFIKRKLANEVSLLKDQD